MEQWWHYLNKYVQRDQLTFMYLVWQNNIQLNILNINARGNVYFRIKPHLYENINCKFNKVYIKLLESIYNNPKILKIQFFLNFYKKICKGLF